MSGGLNPQNQKTIGLVVLTFLALATIFFGLKTIPGRIIKPFNLQPSGRSGVGIDKEAQKQAALLALKNQDTDKDGLNDYDELTFYKTSPYLEDSDSDGFKDKEEIDSGYDPNCPQGQDCRLAIGALPSAKESQQKELKETLIKGVETPSPSNQSTVLGLGLDNLTPAQIRQLLEENGFKKEDLAKLDDKVLLEVWKESVQKTVQNSP